MRKLKRSCFWIGLWVVAAQAQPRPSPADQSRSLEIARSTALHYTSALPDFICTEMVERSTSVISSYEGKRGGSPQGTSDKLAIQLTYFGQTEKYKLLAINGSPADKPIESLQGLLSGGEFGSMLFRIFDPASAAEFQWKGWTTVAKRRCSVYSYRVERANSHHSVGYRTGAGELRTTIVGYAGVIALDIQTSTVLRLTLEASDIPAAFKILHSSTAVEYGFTDVGGREYLLPARAETEMSRSLDSPPSTSYIANTVSFVEYRKFSADANIDFSSPEQKKK
jgi:hypothetical protein